MPFPREETTPPVTKMKLVSPAVGPLHSGSSLDGAEAETP